MEKEVKVTVYEKDAIQVFANFSKFNGTVQEWKNATYELFRYNMTFGFAYYIDIRENYKKDVYVVILLRPAYKDALIETMKDLGFDPTITEEKVGVIECTEFPDDMLLAHLEIEN